MCVPGCFGAGPDRPDGLTNQALIRCLTERSSACPPDVQAEVLKRGEAMLPLLMSLEGDRRPYGGGSLGKPQDSMLVFYQPTGQAEFDRDKVVTTEVAALYLACAIYEQRLDFAGVPYLSDARLPPEKRDATVSPELVKRAWIAAQGWMKDVAAKGLLTMRRTGRGPLTGSQGYFWGSTGADALEHR